MKSYLILIYIVTCAAIFISCAPSAKLYKTNTYTKARLHAASLDSLKNYLQSSAIGNINDTIIIKYEFDNESCWNLLDQQNSTDIKTVITNIQNHRKQQSELRPDISIFHYKEKGSKKNKLVEWNPDIRPDNGYLKHLLFGEQTVCGTSAIIFPTGEYLLIKSDSHFTALNLTGKQINEALQQATN